jgi:DNA-directed RNA polymerase specialized sigma24 family protein
MCRNRPPIVERKLMMKDALLSFPSDQCVSVDTVLVKIDPQLFALTQSIASCELAAWECDEIVQSVRIKLFKALPGKAIANFGGYLKQTVHNEYVSFLRRRKSLLPIPINDDGEPYQGRVLISLSEGMRDPQMEVEHEMASLALMEKLVDAILHLPLVQQLAMVCFLRERVDNPALLVAAFKKRDVDVERYRWPDDKDAKKRLKASCYYARVKIAQDLNIDLAAYKGLRSPKKR